MLHSDEEDFVDDRATQPVRRRRLRRRIAADSSEEEGPRDQRSSQHDASSDESDLDGFIVPDSPPRRKRAAPSRGPDGPDGPNTSNDSGDSDSSDGSGSHDESELSSDDETASSDSDAPAEVEHRSRKEILRAASKISGWSVFNGVVYRLSLGKHSRSKRATGSYAQIVVPDLTRVLGESAANYELCAEKKPVFFVGMDVTHCFDIEGNDFDAIGCLCTQTPTRGGIHRLFNVHHRPSGVDFLMGECCAHFASARDVRDKQYICSGDSELREHFGLRQNESI